MNHSDTPSHVSKTVTPVPGFDGLTLCVYGQVSARTLTDDMQQGYYVALHGQPIARAELPEEQKAAVRALLLEKFPEQAAI